MSRLTFRIGALALAALFLASSAGAVNRVSKSLGVLEIYGGYSSPTGKIDHLGNTDFMRNYNPLDISSKDVFNSSMTLGLGLGAVKKGHWYGSLAVQYSHLRVKDVITFPPGDSAIYFGGSSSPKPHYNQYELKINSNYQFNDIEVTSWTPYIGLGFGVGLTSQTLSGYQSEHEFNIGLALNFGAEAKLWEDGNKRNLVTLASANSWEFFGSGYRPKFLTIGAALKFYSRM